MQLCPCGQINKKKFKCLHLLHSIVLVCLSVRKLAKSNLVFKLKTYIIYQLFILNNIFKLKENRIEFERERIVINKYDT